MNLLFVCGVFFTLLSRKAADGFLRLPNNRRSTSGLHFLPSSTPHDGRRFFHQRNQNGMKPKWQQSPSTFEIRKKHTKSTSTSTQNQMMTMMMCPSSRQHAAVIVFSKWVLKKLKISNGSAITTSTSTANVLRRGGAVVALLRGGASAAAPKLSTWIGPALACASSYACYNLFIKKASSSIDPILGGVLLQFVAALIGTALLILQTVTTTPTNGAKFALSMTKAGLLWSVAAGCAVGSAEILSFIISGMGVEATKSVPIIIGGSIVVGTIVGAAWLQERLTIRGWFGVFLIAFGICLVGIDPGSSMGY